MSNEIKALTMPKWGLAMTEGAVTSWLVEDGAALREGDEILEIETTKITNVYESPASGTLRRRTVEAGQTVPVGALLLSLHDFRRSSRWRRLKPPMPRDLSRSSLMPVAGGFGIWSWERTGEARAKLPSS
jgi:hypothetical protein